MNADYARGQTLPDDHGNNPSTATQVSLDTSVLGRIDPASDVDIFSLNLSEQSEPIDVWIYATGDFDSVGFLFDSNLDQIAANDESHIEGRQSSFHIRTTLEPGAYYILVRSFARSFVGNYTLHIERVSDHGDSIDTATHLEFYSPVAGRFDSEAQEHYFRLEITEHDNLLLSVRNPAIVVGDGELQPVSPVDFALYDADGQEITVVNVDFRSIYGMTYGFAIRDDFAPSTYYISLSPYEYSGNVFPIYYAINLVEDIAYDEFLSECATLTEAREDPIIGDPLYGCQWHLNQPSGEDINVESVWADGITGEGINVAVVDDGMDAAHEDLVDNVDLSLSHDYEGKGDLFRRYEHHGTAVAGVIAARDNDVGVRGVAPRSTIFGYNLLHGLALADTETAELALIADAAGRNAGVTAISNNSWGFVDTGEPMLPSAFWENIVDNAVTRGYDGRGVLYVWAAGNGHRRGDDSNLDGRANYYAITAACAVNESGTRSASSEFGANLWVCAPSNHPRTEENYRGITTTENSNRYRDDFGGTSSATPTVSGVAALIRQANPDLTWRDVKLILAESARKNDPSSEGWMDGATTYGHGSDRYHFNHEYGFGVVDAAAAVDLAKVWINLPPLKTATVDSGEIYRNIPEAYDAASIDTVDLTLTLELGTDIEFTEFVEINVNLQHESFRDLSIELESPSGAVSKLAVSYDTFTDDDDPTNDYFPLRGPYRFGSARHLGEDPNGTWTLRLTDRYRLGIGFIRSWGITVYGHTQAPEQNLSPAFAEGETTSRAVAENTSAGKPVGEPITAIDYDALTYTLSGPDAGLFGIDSASGQVTVGDGTSLDYETRKDYSVSVTASDPSGASDSISVDIVVTDVSLGELGDRYDANRNERIEFDEVNQAINDYLFDDTLTRDEVLEIINLFLFG